jgi:hypothetical protein
MNRSRLAQDLLQCCSKESRAGVAMPFSTKRKKLTGQGKKMPAQAY